MRTIGSSKPSIIQLSKPCARRAKTIFSQASAVVLLAQSLASARLNAVGNFKKVAFKIARTLDKQLPVTAFNPADAKLWASKTTALACENMVLALRAHGFDSCMMEGFDEPMVRKLLKLNDQQFPVMVIAAGERAEDGVFFPQYRFDRDLFIQKI